MATLAIGVSVNVYYVGPYGSNSQVMGTVSEINSGYITVTNGSGNDISIGWENVNMVVS